MRNDHTEITQLVKLITNLVVALFVIVILGASVIGILYAKPDFFNTLFSKQELVTQQVEIERPIYWKAPDVNTIPANALGEEILYGKELVAHTSDYLGPKGTILQMSNGMNCQNCHLDAGTKPFGNNYSAVASTYPKFRARSGTQETIEKRVNDCFERSLNGTSLKEDSKEMKAIVAYIHWLGTDVKKNEVPVGAGLTELSFLDRAADPLRGKLVYEEKCTVCHSKNGEGIANAENTGWTYPPLWGEKSYNNGAGLFRLSRFAGYIKTNMPLGATADAPQLSDEEAWDIAAYVNSMDRPSKDLSKDWPDISKKPLDHPFGPFNDGFDEKQHKYGPFLPIKEKRKDQSK